MPQILLPQRFLSQPQGAVRLDPAHPLFKDLVLAYSAGRGLQDAKHGLGSNVGTMLYGVGQKGRYTIPGDNTSYAQFADNPSYNTLGEVTVVAQIRTGGLTVQQGIITKCETSGGTNTPFGLFTESGGAVALNRANASGGTAFRVWASAVTLSADTHYVIAVTQGADISVAPKFYVNGVFDTGSANSLYGGSATGAPTGNATSVKIGNRTDLASQYFGQVYDALVFKRILSASEIASLSGNIWSIWKASRRLWTVSTVTTHDLLGVGQISSAEAFGALALSAGVTSSGIESGEALGSAGVTAGVSATGIATVEAVGSAAIAAGVSTAGIDTAEAEGSPQLTADIASSAIASTEALGAATLVATIQAAGIASTEAVGAPEVGGVAPANVIGAGTIASAEASGSPAVSATVEGSGISSAESLGQPAVGIPAASVAGAGQITSGEAFGSPAAALAVAVAGIDGAETAGNAAVVVAIDGAGNIATAEAVGAPFVGETSPQQITGAGGIVSTEAFGSANIHPLVPYTGTGFQQGSGHRPVRRAHRQPSPATVPHSIGAAGIESAERLGYPALTWRGRTRRIREEEFLLGRAA